MKEQKIVTQKHIENLSPVAREQFLKLHAGKKVRIFNGQRKMYWKPAAWGYTENAEEAGVYEFVEAWRYTRDSDKDIHYEVID